ncbi:hypothetical protein NP493_3447g00011 [Ridgeia piscesae]|uniref:Frizzled-4 n=1 Tax=Ridgeia piscesae TaxID=27915 RepID=A0AAD9MX43_RIDPI|nr:hypothetical protein NP493_3447g00011 [Ridgeia piscesae]
MCNDACLRLQVRQPIGPCRPMCERVRDDCRPVLHEFGFPWPAALDCSQFPASNDLDHMCMDGPSPGSDTSGQRVDYTLPLPRAPPSLPPSPPPSAACRHLRHPGAYVYVNRTERCAVRCGADALFTSGEKRLTETWMSVCAALCFLSTLFAVLTFLVDPRRFRYPERPVIALAMCQCACAVAYGVRLAAGSRRVACDRLTGALIGDGLGNTDCTIVFLLLYYFGTAASLWWVILTVTWFLSAGLRWSHDAIERYSSHFHLVAWAAPAVQTIVVLVSRAVDADELTGMCYVGHARARSLVAFALAPLATHLAVGVGFTVAAYAALFRYRSRVRSGVEKTAKLEQFMVRVGVFCLLCALPVTCIVACLAYEYVNSATWRLPGSSAKPGVEIFMLKIVMSLIVGMTTGPWTWSRQTIDSWRKFARRMRARCCCDDRARAARRKRAVPQYHYHGSAHVTTPAIYYRTYSAVDSSSKHKTSGSVTVV